MSQLLNDSIERREPTPAPEWVEQLCAQFGKTESGAPKYRIVWNPDRTRMCFGREIRKYPRLGDRWIVEVLLPWEIYGFWNEEAFGPKPPDGEYCHTHTIQSDLVGMMTAPSSERTEYMSLDDFGRDNLALLLYCIEKGRAVQAWQVRQYDEEQLAIEEKEFHEQFENVYDDHAAELAAIDKLCEDSKLKTSLDPLPKELQEDRLRKARKAGKNIIH